MEYRNSSALAGSILAALLPAVAVVLMPVPATAAWPALLGDEVHSSVIAADLEGDGAMEAVVFSTDGKLHVLDPQGNEHAGAWPLQLGPASSIADGQNWVSGSAALVDIDGAPGREILQATFDGRLHALSPEGQERPGFPIAMGAYSTDTPTVGDLDGDGDVEILCRYNPGGVGLWSHTGSMLPGWPKSIANAPGGAIDVWSSAAFADLDGDGDLEIVMGSYDGYAYAYHHTGAGVAGWPVNLNPSGGYPGWVLSSPASADFDGDGSDEIVIGCDDSKLYVLRGDGTSFAPGVWPREIPFGFRASPALGDLDGDGDLEIVIGNRSNFGDLRLYAIHHTGADVAGWPVIQAAGMGGYTFGWLSPVLADLTGDGRCEVITVKERRSANPDQAEIAGFTPGGATLPGFPIPLQGLAYGMPTVCDVDGDGLAEVMIGDLTRRVYKIDLLQTFDPSRDELEWTRLQKDLGNTGRFRLSPAAVPDLFVSARAHARPNPGARWVELFGGAAGAAWRVYDVTGRCVAVLASDGRGCSRWDCAGVAAGRYAAVLGGGNARATITIAR